MIRDVVRYKAPAIWGVLCIDIWEDPSNVLFYQNALSKLSKYSIGAIVNCTVDLKIDYDDVSVYNTLEQYHWNKKLDTNDQIADNILLDLVKSSGARKTSQDIHDQLFNRQTVHLSRKDTFNYHSQKHDPNIQDWIVIGSAWNKCLHYGPLGVDKLVDMINHKFHIFPEWSIQTENQENPSTQQLHDDFFVWAPIDNGGYRLITRAKNHKWIETI